jgi:hypothetical protein
VYALMEADQDQSGLYRSDDSGATWTRVSNDRRLTGRPFYYIYVDVDPTDPETVWVNNLSLVKSTDGGKAWTTIPTPHGDNHGMWFNPSDPDILIQSNDGGANVSLDGGQTWSTQDNQPTAEFYGVFLDDEFPYNLYVAQQDSSTFIFPSTADPFDGSVIRNGPGCETGPRYGISLDDETLRALGISPPAARQAPWPLIRVFAPGPALSRADAMTQHDTLAAPAEAAPLTEANGPQ